MVKERQKEEITPVLKLKWWGDGSWVYEPDFYEFTHKGVKCMIRRGFYREGINLERVFGGYLCGYVQLPDNHPWKDKKLNIEADVHGGITFNDTWDFTYGHWVGFDCAHFLDLIPSNKNLYQFFEENDVFKHEYRDFKYVKTECENLAEQVIKSIK